MTLDIQMDNSSRISYPSMAKLENHGSLIKKIKNTSILYLNDEQTCQ